MHGADVFENFALFIQSLQKEIVAEIENEEGVSGKKFSEHKWQNATGSGRALIIQNGKYIEKGGVNYSIIKNADPTEGMISSMLPKITKTPKQNAKLSELLSSRYTISATGISIVIHPLNPFCPTVHCNYRMFCLNNKQVSLAWFGGGCDLTPYYMFSEDAFHFHKVIKEVCDKYSEDFYPKYKKQCDEYFYLKNRKEHRGIGGIFFDYEREVNLFGNFVMDCAKAFTRQYVPILSRRKDLPYTNENVLWQHVRRSRYVEFNLLYDRGTIFGLSSTNVNVENVLMSLPPVCRWEYDFKVAQDTLENELLEALVTPRNWA